MKRQMTSVQIAYFTERWTGFFYKEKNVNISQSRMRSDML